MQIQEATIHQLIKAAETSGEKCVIQKARPIPLPLDQVLTTLCADLLAMYSKSANSNGTLGQNPTLHTFPLRLAEYTKKKITFQAFSLDTLGLIGKEMQEAFFANGGYALFLRYQHDNADFLLVAMLKLKAGAGIDKDTLSLQPTLNIDLNYLHEAARINLTRLASSTEPYLSFIKGRAKSGNVSDYFRSALSCENFTNSRHHTEHLIKAADAFFEARTDFTSVEAKATEKTDMRRRLYECFAANPTEVVLPTLAAAIMPSEPQDFVDFVRTGPQADQFQINDSFKPEKSVFSRLKRLRGKMGSVSVAFDVDDVQSKRVRYDPQAGSLVLANPSADLIAEIQKYDRPVAT